MKEIKAYKIFDGRIFEDKEKAEEHERYAFFDEWYKDHKIFDYDGEILCEDYKLLYNWLQENKEYLKAIL